MRLAVVILALAACTTETDLERLESLLAQNEIVCATYDVDPPIGAPMGVPPEQMLVCMNDALASGARAETNWETYPGPFSSGYRMRTHVFTVDHQVKVFESWPSGDGFMGPYATEQPTCAGPFHLGTTYSNFTTLAWDCP